MQKKTELSYSDFATYLPVYDFDEKQNQFFQDTFEIITNNKDTSKVTCFADRCGIGKSTFIKTFMHCCIGDFCHQQHCVPQGLIVVTDSIKRLEELSDGERDRIEAEKAWGELFRDWGIESHYNDFENSIIVLRSDEPFMEQLIQQQYKPIVLLSTQRYFMLSEDIREQLFSFLYKGKRLRRDIVIFDECPYFSETITIDSDNLTRIESALYKGLSDEVKDKDFVIREFKGFKDKLLDSMDEKEHISEKSNVTIYWKDKNCSSMTRNDDLLFKVVQDNIEPLTKQYNAILKDLRCLQTIAKEGAIFNSVKKRNGKYERSFVLIVDNRECFYLKGDTKFFVFDGTADIDPRYNLDYVEIIDGSKYNNPLNLHITNVHMTTSKKVLCRTAGDTEIANITIKVIKKYLQNKIRNSIGNKRKMLIVTYSELFGKFQKDFEYVGYFGNLKGFNTYKNLFKMAHVGVNRYPHMAYFYIYCGCNMEVYKSLSRMSEKESLDFFNDLNQTPERNRKYKDIIYNIMIKSMLVDFEQNIFRLAIRNYNNKETVNIWTFYNSYSYVYKQLSRAIEDRYSPYGATFEYEETPIELQIAKAKSRKPPKNKKYTNAQKIIEWCDKQDKGKIFKIKEMLNEIGISREAFKTSKRDNSVIKGMFNQMKTSKQGYYQIM